MVPLTDFCEWTPDNHDLGDSKPACKGEMWLAGTDQPIFAVAGFWQETIRSPDDGSYRWGERIRAVIIREGAG